MNASLDMALTTAAAPTLGSAATSYRALPESIDLLSAMAIGAGIGAGVGGAVGLIAGRDPGEATAAGALGGLVAGAMYVILGLVGLYS